MNPQQVARAGEMFVAAEIHRRGGYAVTFAGNMPGIDILASDAADTRRISIQVKREQRLVACALPKGRGRVQRRSRRDLFLGLRGPRR